MVKYKGTMVVSKSGVNFVRTAVEASGSLFHKIEQESDLGIDAMVELLRDEHPINKMMACQIKSGQTYFDERSNECRIPVGNHYAYWRNHPLPIFGFVYVPTLKKAYWIDITEYLHLNPNATLIKFKATRSNELVEDNFKTLFMPVVLREVPHFSFENAASLFKSDNSDEKFMGMSVLFRKFPNEKETWAFLVSYFLEANLRDIPPVLIYYFAHVPWHPDIAASGEIVKGETRDYAKSLFDKFTKSDIIKLLEFIDPEDMIARGTLGQSVEAIVSSLKCGLSFCADIANDNSQSMSLRERSALLCAIHGNVQPAARLAKLGSWYSQEIVNHIENYGELNPY